MQMTEPKVDREKLERQLYHPRVRIAATAVEELAKLERKRKAVPARRRRTRRPADMHLYIENHPVLGSGRRGVIVRTVGHKWVHVEAAATGRPARFKRAEWDRILKANGVGA